MEVRSQVAQQLPTGRCVAAVPVPRLKSEQEGRDPLLVESLDRESLIFEPAAQVRNEPQLCLC